MTRPGSRTTRAGRPSQRRGGQGGWYRGTRARRQGLVPSAVTAPAEGQPVTDRPTARYRVLPPQVDLPAVEQGVLELWARDDTFAAVAGRRPPAVRRGPSTRVRRRPTASRACTTSRRGSSRTCSPGSGRCRATTSCARPAGTATACPSRSPSRRSSASPARATSRRTASPSSTPAAGQSVLRHVDEFEAMTERMGYWVDTSDGLLDDGPGLRRERLVVAQADLRQGPARPGPPGRALLPPLRHRAVRPRARAGLRDRRRPVRLRAASR